MTPVGRAFNLHCTTEKIDVIVVDVNLNHMTGEYPICPLTQMQFFDSYQIYFYLSWLF